MCEGHQLGWIKYRYSQAILLKMSIVPMSSDEDSFLFNVLIQWFVDKCICFFFLSFPCWISQTTFSSTIRWSCSIGHISFINKVMRIQLPSGVKVEVIMNMRIPIIEFLLPGQKFISTLLSDILTILGIIWACKVFLDCFYN